MPLRRIESIFHPSDFSEASAIAFNHALKIALVSRAKLNMLHVAADPDADWNDFPGVRATLERWGLIPAGSPKSAVGNLGIDVTKIIASSTRPVKALQRFPGSASCGPRRAGGPSTRGSHAMAGAAHRQSGCAARWSSDAVPA